MPPPTLEQLLAQAVADLLAGNRSYFGAGGPGYYGVRVDCISSGGSEFDLTLTFKAGVHYCCVEWGCHFPLYSSGNCEGWFDELRERLRAAGIESPPPLAIRNLHVVVEVGAISDDWNNTPVPHESVLEYDIGPFHEAGPPAAGAAEP